MRDLADRVKLIKDQNLTELDQGKDLTEVCLSIVGTLFDCLDSRMYLMPVTLRIMLKLRIGL
jgi:hypothetical protein